MSDPMNPGGMFNTPKNRSAFIQEFGGIEHPHGPWTVDERAADLILGALDRYPDRYWVPDNLWSFIMQRRETFMVGEPYFLTHRNRNIRVTNEKWAEIKMIVMTRVYDWLKALPEYKNVPAPKKEN